MSRGYANLQFTACADTPVRISNRAMLTIGDERHEITFSGGGAEDVCDLIARAFETLASAPDLTPEERTAVRDRMTQAVESVRPISYRLPADADGGIALCDLPPPADATADELSHFTDDAVICGGRIVDPFGNHGHCTLDRGHNSDCTNVREWRVGA